MASDKAKRFAELAVIAAGFLLLAAAVKMHWVTNFMIFCIFALSYDLLYGYMGHLSFGHMLYFGTGAYGTALWLVYGNNNSLMGLLTGLTATALCSGLVGLIVVRNRGAAFALINMAFNEIGYFLVTSALVGLTRGADGLSCTAGRMFGFVNFYDDAHAFYFVLLIVLAAFCFLRILTQSSYGVLIRSVKENEKRTQFLGYNTFIYKWITFVLSSALAGLSGGLFALIQGFVSPGSIHPFGNVDVIFAVLIGGAGNLFGALIGGNVLMVIKHLLPTLVPGLEKIAGVKLPQWEMWLGITLLIIVFVLRQGIFGFLRRFWSTLRSEAMKKPV
jgi:branched-chain amino acid transport system permease protein